MASKLVAALLAGFVIGTASTLLVAFKTGGMGASAAFLIAPKREGDSITSKAFAFPGGSQSRVSASPKQTSRTPISGVEEQANGPDERIVS